MLKTIRASLALAAIAAHSAAPGFSQSSGQAIYKEKCLNCHGPSGLADAGVGKLMRVKPVTDPEVRNLTEMEMVEIARNGKGKMQPYKNELSEAQIKAAVEYLRSFLK